MKFTKYSLFFSVLLVESILLFLLAPRHYDYNFNLFCMIQYFVSSFLFLKAKKKQNYFDFDMIFMFTYFFVMFFYPVFMFQSDPTKYFAFQYEFNENVISRATALSLLGMQAYFSGSLSFSNKQFKKMLPQKKYNSITTFSIISFVSFFLFIISGGYARLAGEYSGEAVEASGAASYFWVFSPAFLFCAIAFQFNNLYIIDQNKFRLKYLNKFLILYLFFFVGMILVAGSRTYPLQIILICCSLFTLFYKPISFFKFIPLIIIGVLAMFGINLLRGGDTTLELVDSVMDLVICNRNTYVSIDYVDVHGLTFGKSMLSVLLAPIPMMQSIIFSIFNIDSWDTSSALIISRISLGDKGSLGFGTNIIADLYMSFGLLGVVFFMFLLGKYIAKLLYFAKNNIYALVGYSVMISYSVFIVRAEFFFFSRFLLWGLFFVFCLDVYNNSIKRNNLKQ
ncbi:O-antigen polymerase [Flavobacterium piscisymbiosum]|uniref:Oligosaccharide repeat unit polymerase n=1 Tax=Flavobacterium piscisymbiosum TaxID=2893753 RepID=A0ABS8M9W8_9FLAO|nr:O-antigen polymerase [Flavobacterium sp. F-30]MCC9061741.1 oligosaccharide repeat unit polymerase [Flavobacterium sp. F-30]